MSIIESANFFEFANSLDDLILEILYDSNKGYINTISKEAITQAQDKINYFDENTFKLIEEYKISNAENLIKEKRETLLSVIRKHYQEQALIWCDEIYRNCIENCKTLIAINRDNPEIADKNFQKALALINWISSVKNLNQKEQNILLDDFNRELDEIIKSNKYNLLQNRIKSDEKTFIELYEKVKTEEFLELNLLNYEEKLSKEDFEYFKQLQNSLSSYKANSIKDEVRLIETGFEFLNLKNDKDKYDFIKQVLNDFSYSRFENKKLTKKDKAVLVKERILIFKNGDNYFKNLIKQEKP